MQDILRALYQIDKPKDFLEPNSFRRKNAIYRKANQSYKVKDRYPQALPSYTRSTDFQSNNGDHQSRKHLPKSINKSLDLRMKFQTIDHLKIQKYENQTHLPIINKKNSNKYKKKTNKIRVATKLKKARKIKLLEKKSQSMMLSSKLLLIIEKTVRNYYCNFLQEQLLYYVSLLQIKIEMPNVDLTKQIINNLYFIAKKLSQSTIRKDFLQFLLSVSRNTCFLPNQFLSQLEISRLQFSPKIGSLVNVSKQQTRMIVGLFIGVKVFCTYILYRPWQLNLSKVDFEKNYSKIQEIISNVGSVFYYLILDQFLNYPQIFLKTPQKQTLKKFKIYPMNKINIYPIKSIKYFEKSTDEQLIPNQSRDFLKSVMKTDRQKIHKIKSFLMKWIDRITALIYKDSDMDLYISIRKKNHRHSQSNTIQR